MRMAGNLAGKKIYTPDETLSSEQEKLTEILSVLLGKNIYDEPTDLFITTTDPTGDEVSGVYPGHDAQGNPLDVNRFNAIRDVLQESYPGIIHYTDKIPNKENPNKIHRLPIWETTVTFLADGEEQSATILFAATRDSTFNVAPDLKSLTPIERAQFSPGSHLKSANNKPEMNQKAVLLSVNGQKADPVEFDLTDLGSATILPKLGPSNCRICIMEMKIFNPYGEIISTEELQDMLDLAMEADNKAKKTQHPERGVHVITRQENGTFILKQQLH